MLEKVFTTQSKIESMGIKHLLEEEGIKLQYIDKTDRSYPGLFGYIEIRVDEADKEKALSLIDSYFEKE